jgi:capsular polysaccharide biosynthesis protein
MMQKRESQNTSKAKYIASIEIDKLIKLGKLQQAKKEITSQLRQDSADAYLFQKQAEIDHLLGSNLLFAQPRKLTFQTTLTLDNKPYLSINDWANNPKPAYFEKNLNDREDCSDYLELLACDNAYTTEAYGIHDEAGYPFWGTVLIRGKNKVNYPRGYPTKIPRPANIQLRLKRAFYINFLQLKNFGHLLTDGASAIYPLIQWKLHNSDLRLMPIIINETDSSQDFQIQLLAELLNIDKSQIYIPGKTCGNIKIQTLYQSKPSYILGIKPSKLHPQLVRDLLKQKQETSEDTSLKKDDGNLINTTKLYIARSKLTTNVRHLKEEIEIEECLQGLGWTIFHPQEHSIKHQLKVYEICKVICGEEGSAMHLLFGLGIHAIKKVILLTQSYKNNFTLQLDCQSIPKTVIYCLTKNPNCNKPGTRQDLQLCENTNSKILTKTIDNYATIAISKQ